jgi:hypothetical protein
MDFAGAVSEVLTITARPDKVTEIESALNWAISYCCLRSNFANDLVESTLTISPTSYGNTIQFNNVLDNPPVTRFRKFKYVKPYGVRKYLRPIDSDKIFSPAASMQQDVYYVAGNHLTYILSAPAPSLEIGYYQYPPILDQSVVTSFWLLDVAPWAAIDLAAARIFRSIGDDQSMQQYQVMGEEQLKVARRDFEDNVRHAGT